MMPKLFRLKEKGLQWNHHQKLGWILLSIMISFWILNLTISYYFFNKNTANWVYQLTSAFLSLFMAIMMIVTLKRVEKLLEIVPNLKKHRGVMMIHIFMFAWFSVVSFTQVFFDYDRANHIEDAIEFKDIYFKLVISHEVITFFI